MGKTEKLNMVEALNLALREEMRRDKDVILLGEDVGVDGGVFRVTKGLISEFGPERVVDTPLAEAAIIGASVGLALYGKKPICEIQFSGFIYLGFEHLQSHAARFRLRSWGAYQVPMVLRAPYGGGIKALEHHSESAEMIYIHACPGLTVVIPSGPRKARGLIKSAIRAKEPIVFLEPQAIYRSFREEVPMDEEDLFPIGKAEIVRPGSQITVVTYGAMLRTTKLALENGIKQQGWDPELIDLLTLSPMDYETVIESVKKTGRLVVVHEAPRTGGMASELIARVNEFALLQLQAPVERVTGWDTPVPFYSREAVYIPDVQRIEAAVRKTIGF